MAVINTALLSFGMSGRVFHAPFIALHPGFNLAGCWERSAKRMGESYPQTRSYDSLQALLDDESVDLVVVNTPTWTHYDYTRRALEAGKHVVVEKAFAGNAEEATDLRDLARVAGRKLAVFQNRRWDSDFLSVREVLDEGDLGDIVEANFGFLRFDPGLSPKIHKEEPSSGAGIVKDLGPHVIDQAMVLFGLPESVFADIDITRPSSRVDDYFDISLFYSDKRIHVKGGYFFRQPMPEYSLFGKSGCYLKRRSDVQERQLDAGMSPDDSDYGWEPTGREGQLYLGAGSEGEQELITAPQGNYTNFYDGMYEAIANDRPEPVTADDGVRVMRVIDAAFESQQSGRVVRL